MVNSVFAAVAVLALSQAVGAIPTANTVEPRFSFVEWVDSIIANPDGDHLTPEEAVAAFHAAGGSSQTFGEFATLYYHLPQQSTALPYGR